MKGMNTMKKEIHPEYNKMKIKCVCGNEIETGSIEENITVESSCQLLPGPREMGEAFWAIPRRLGTELKHNQRIN